MPIRLRLRTRKFFCDNKSCERSIFCERLLEIAVRARKTDRLQEALLAISLELGGRAGARLAAELGLSVGRDALLESIKDIHPRGIENLKVVGIDDFGFKRGNTSGTIMVDLESHKVVDLVRGHSKELIANWLRQRPNLEIVARDRSHVCREGVEAGAPEAKQVADRWHLLKSLTEGLEEYLLSKRPALKKAAIPEVEPEDVPEEYHAPTAEVPLQRPYESIEEPARKRHESIVEQWREIRRLHLAGAQVQDIAHWAGVSRRTVYRYRELAEPPPRREHKKRGSVLDPYAPYLVRRWNEGCRSPGKLYEEIREQGYAHSITTVKRLLSNLRYTEEQGKKLSSTPKAKRNSIFGASPTARKVAGLFMRREEHLDEEQKKYLKRLCDSDTAVADARRLIREFTAMVRGLEGEKLDVWLAEAEASEAMVMSKFAAGIRRDFSAVRAGLTESWSTGLVEGYIHKVKLIKRQGYGRADFDLLRARVLAA